MSEQRLQTICLVVLTAIALCASLAWLRTALVPFVLAVFFFIALGPVVAWQRRVFRMPRVVAVASTLILGGVLFVFVGGLITVSVGQMTRNADAYQEQMARLVGWVEAALPEWVPLPDSAELRDRVPGYARRAVVATLNGIRAVVSQGLVVLIFLFFLLLGRDRVVAPGSVRYEIEARVRKYIVTKVAVSLVTGVIVGAILGLLGVPLALVFGLLAFLLNFIPNVGSIIASLLPLPVVLLAPELTPTAKVAALAGPAIVQFLVGNVIEPQLMGQSVELYPIVILLALIFWGSLWGIVGMLLAVPLTASLKILLERLELTRPVAAVLGGRAEET